MMLLPVLPILKMCCQEEHYLVSESLSAQNKSVFYSATPKAGGSEYTTCKISRLYIVLTLIGSAISVELLNIVATI